MAFNQVPAMSRGCLMCSWGTERKCSIWRDTQSGPVIAGNFPTVHICAQTFVILMPVQLPPIAAGSFFIHSDFIHAAKLCIFLFWACCTSRVNTQHCHLLGHLWVYDRLWYDVHGSDWRKSGCVVRFKLHKKERLAQKIFLKGLSHLDVAFCFVIRSVCNWLLNRRRRRSLGHLGSTNSKNLRSWVPLCISNNFFYTFWLRSLDVWI